MGREHRSLLFVSGQRVFSLSAGRGGAIREPHSPSTTAALLFIFPSHNSPMDESVTIDGLARERLGLLAELWKLTPEQRSEMVRQIGTTTMRDGTVPIDVAMRAVDLAKLRGESLGGELLNER